MKLLLDQGLPRSTVVHLATLGIAAEHVGALGIGNATDTAILEAAIDSQAIVVTLDADFHRLLATSKARSPSVIRIRIERLKGDQLANILAQALSGISTELEAGAVVSVTPSRIRARLLPIGR